MEKQPWSFRACSHYENLTKDAKLGTYGKIWHILPVQRGRVMVKNITFINALLYICENGCKWSRLPKEYSSRHVIYKRFNRRVKDGQCHDAPHGRLLMETVGPLGTAAPLVMDRAYEDDKTRRTAWSLGFSPVVPPKSNRADPWEYDTVLYRRRNEIERLFRLMQGFRRIFCRFEKLDMMYTCFIQLALVCVPIK